MNYAAIRARAHNTIRRSGKTVILSLAVDSAYDPITGATTSTTETYFAYAVEIAYQQFERDGELVLADDKRFLISGLQTNGSALPVITTAFKLSSGGVDYEIINVSPLRPGDVAVIYEVQARG